MLRKISLIIFVMALSLSVAVPAFAAPPHPVGGGLGNKAPDFSAGVYADDEAWGTKGTTSLPAPNEHNQQSYDKLFVVTNGAEGQLPVAEAGPGNSDYNGGRWSVYEVTWEMGITPVLLTSYEDVMFHADDLIIVAANAYFQCPLLPVK